MIHTLISFLALSFLVNGRLQITRSPGCVNHVTYSKSYVTPERFNDPIFTPIKMCVCLSVIPAMKLLTGELHFRKHSTIKRK
jgi:hypothetical protein